MDKKKIKQLEHKVHKVERQKDRGDVSKNINSKPSKRKESEDLQNHHPAGSGDNKRKLRTVDKSNKTEMKPILEVKKELVSQSTNTEKNVVAPKKPIERIEKVVEHDASVEYRKRIRDRYTMKPRVAQKANENGSNKDALSKFSNGPKVEIEIDQTTKQQPSTDRPLDYREVSRESHKSDKTKTDKGSVKKNPSPPVRKPIVKTITSKQDHTRVFKAVTFVDQNRGHRKPLKVTIPNIQKKSKPIAVSVKKESKAVMTRSRASVKLKPVKLRTEAKCKRRRVRLLSPELTMVKDVSPPTEVAKWAPSSINRHTMPYYEAWVNTTLAAISKNSPKDKLFLEKLNELKAYQKQLQQRDMSPELVYEKLGDERYTGRIKVTQR